MPPTLHTYTVAPTLPARLAPLEEMAYNLRWSWDHPTRRLFALLGGPLWEASGHNPAKMLGLVSQARYEEAAKDAGFTSELDDVYRDFRRYMDGETWWSRTFGGEFNPQTPVDAGGADAGEAIISGGQKDLRIAYFSAEFGITECLPIYSGGLGVLAGDHLKSASDLGLPLVAIGFLYQKGYFRQALNADGWQIENYPATDFYSLPIRPVPGADNGPFVITVNFPGRQVFVQVWKAQVGRVPLYLLDTNLPQNNEADRHIAGNLYGGDVETRIQQELVLGIGGVHALHAMHITPTVCHMNEGHSAFLALERVRRLVQEKGLSFNDATEAAAAGNLFTTHTPVPAGFDLFPPDLMHKYFADYAMGALGINFGELMDRGRIRQGDPNEKFNMAVLAFRHARYINGVSKLHGVVSRKMAQPSFAGLPEEEVPIGYVTNGIHTRTFQSEEITDVLDRHLGEPTPEKLRDPAYWARVESIPDADLWAAHERCRAKLVDWARKYRVAKLEKRNARDQEIDEAREMLDPDVLTIGFARRFATYKRGDLFLRDVERIKRILNHPDRPVQFVFAGKAHPKDDAGKDLVRRIVHFARAEDVRRRVVFLEDYDMDMARRMVQGVDVWLNNPRRPMEASGTSGMKVVANAGLNFSVLDGWWAEGYEPSVGWQIGGGEEYEDEGYQDHAEAMDIYETLEREIAPLFYTRDADGLPRGWIAKMKATLMRLAPVYTTNRMVAEYAEKYYVPAARRARHLAENDYARAKELVAWKRVVRDNWGDVKVVSVEADTDKALAGQNIAVRASVRLGAKITPADVSVQLYAGSLDADRGLHDPRVYSLQNTGSSDGTYTYTGTLPTDNSGQQGFTVRVQPAHPDAVLPQELPLISWE